jgi:protein-disulfide isomerase
MSEAQKSSILKWTGVAALAFGMAFAAGRYAGASSSPKLAGAPLALPGGPLTDANLFKVPISLSQPRRGGSEPLVSVVEWCDLHGEPCRNSDVIVTKLLKDYGEDLRHVWRHYAGGTSTEARLAHEYARIVHEQTGKFWEFRQGLLPLDQAPDQPQLLSALQSAGVRPEAAARAVNDHTHLGYVLGDGVFAGRFGVQSVPAYFVNGRRLLGEGSYERLKALVEEELTHAKRLLRQGVAREKLYAEMTKHGLFFVGHDRTSSAPASAKPPERSHAAP